MSDMCGNCNCSDKSQCVKNGSSYVADIGETENSYVETLMMEHNGKCKCGANCSCVDCTCGH